MLKNHSEVFLVILLIFVSSMFLPRILRSHVKVNRIQGEIATINKQTQRLENSNEHIEDIMNSIEDDFYLEKEIRNRLNFQKTDEVIYKYKKEN